MIAACPKCHTRYRVQPEQLGADGARLRCSSCSAVFRVRPPAAAAPAPEPGSLDDASRAGRALAGGAAVPGRSEPPASEARPVAPEPVAPARHRSVSLPAPPEAPEPGPVYDRDRLVLVAHADPDTGKSVAEALEGWGLETLLAQDGVEAMLGIQRALPHAVVLDAALPRMYGFQVCEIVKRNESLRGTRVVLVGAIHKEERYRRAPRELYGADVYVEPPDLPDALLEILRGFGLPVRADDAAGPRRARPEGAYGHIARGASMPGGARDSRTEPLLGDTRAPAGARHQITREAQDGGQASEASAQRGAAERSHQDASALRSEASAQRGAAERSHQDASALRSEASAQRGMAERAKASAPAAVPPVAAPPAAAPADPLAPERAKAERLARIIVSDIVLYNPEKFDAAARSGGDVATAMRDELEEGRALFRERVDAQVRAERDHLAEELARAAKARSGR